MPQAVIYQLHPDRCHPYPLPIRGGSLAAMVCAFALIPVLACGCKRKTVEFGFWSPISANSSPTPNEILIYGPDTIGHDPRIVDAIEEAEEKLVLGQAFERYLKDPAQCSPQFNGLDDTRKRGNIVPRVLWSADGAFTTSDAPQRLHVISVGECGASWASELAVVLQRGTVIARVPLNPGTSIGGLLDLDGDRRLEVLLVGGFTNQGLTIVSASLVRIELASLEVVKDFGQVAQDNCGSLVEPLRIQSMIIHALVRTGVVPVFQTEEISRPCK